MSVVASPIAKGTLRIFASVCGPKVSSPEPVGPEQQNIRLIHVDVGTLRAERKPLVMAMHGHSQDFFRLILADHIIVEMGDNFSRRRDSRE